MEDQKVWYMSRSILGSIVTIIALVAGLFNLTIDTETQNGIVELAMVIAGVFGSFVAIIGRIKASKTIE